MTREWVRAMTEDPGYDASEARSPRGREATGIPWDAAAVRALRARLGITQAELAERLGTRQQTVSEWETGASTPRRMSGRLLGMVAEDAGIYDARALEAAPPPDAHGVAEDGP